MATSSQDQSARPSADASESPDLLFSPGFSVRTVPSWLAKKKVVGGFVIEPIEGGGPNAARHFPNEGSVDGFDLPVLHYAAQRAGALVATQKPMLVFVPIYWNYLDQARLRTPYLSYLSTISEASRRLLVFELAGIPEDLMPTRIEDRIRQLRPYCRSIVCRTRIARRDLSVFGKLPIHAIGIDLGELPPYERGIIPALDDFLDQAEKTQRHTYIHGLTSKSMLIAVQSAGVDFVAGSIIPEAESSAIHPFEIADLYDLPKPAAEGTEP